MIGFKRSIQTLVYLPHFLSWVILGGILLDLLSVDGGMLNQILGSVGIGPIFFLGDGDWFRVTVIVSDIWKDFASPPLFFWQPYPVLTRVCMKRQSSTEQTDFSKCLRLRSLPCYRLRSSLLH